MTRPSPLACFVAGSIVALCVLLAAPSGAHTPGSFYNKRWISNKNVPYAFTTSGRPSSEWRSRVNAAAGTWNTLGEPMRFNNVADTGDFEPKTCPSSYQRNGVHRRAFDGPGGTLARTYLCWTSNGELYSFQLVFDSNDNWYTGTGLPGRNQADLQSVATHELGHATGFAGHFASSAAICNNTSGQHTMCAAHRAGTNRQRSLELHDKHTFQRAY